MNTRDYRSYNIISPFGQFGLLLGLLGAGFVVASIATIIIAKSVLNVPLLEISTALFKPEHVQLQRTLQFVSTLAMFALPALFFAMIINRKPVTYLGFTTNSNFRQLLIVLLLVFTALYAQSILSQLNEMIPLSKSLEHKFKLLEEEYDKQVMSMARMNSVSDFILSLIMLALLPAMFEEMFFRGALQQVFINLFRNAFAGILVTSIVFSAFHFSFYGFLTRMFLGLMLGYIFYYSKNIWLNITAHFLNNAVVVTGLYMLSRSGKLTQQSLEDEYYPMYIGFFAIVAIFALFVFFKRESIKRFPVREVVTAEQNNIPTDNFQNNNPQDI